jgi:hypothetical protein
LVSPSDEAERPAVELTIIPSGDQGGATGTSDAFRLQVVTPSGPRVLSDSDCRVLFRTAVLIVALAMADENGLVGAPPPPQSALRADASAKKNEDTALQPASPAPEPAPEQLASEGPISLRSRASTASVALGAGPAFGLVPGVTASLGLALGLQRGRWGVMLGTHYLLPREHLDRLAQGARVDGFGASLSLTCDPLPTLGFGIGLQGFALRGQGAGIAKQHHDFAWLYGPRLQALWRAIRGEQVDLELGVAGAYLPDSARFQFTDGQLVYATSHFLLEGSLGVRWRFL